MTSHLRLRREKKQTSTPASSLLRGIWKRKLHQTSNAGNESNWEKVCPGSEGCEEVVEREQLLCRRSGRGDGMGWEGVGAQSELYGGPERGEEVWGVVRQIQPRHQLIPPSISRATVLCLDNGHCRISRTLSHAAKKKKKP